VVPFKLSLAMTPSTPVSSALKAIPSTTVCTNTIASKTGGNAADC
jgi:hypothetical protein